MSRRTKQQQQSQYAQRAEEHSESEDSSTDSSGSDDEGVEHKRRRPWTEQEDELLRKLVAQYGGETVCIMISACLASPNLTVQ